MSVSELGEDWCQAFSVSVGYCFEVYINAAGDDEAVIMLSKHSSRSSLRASLSSLRLLFESPLEKSLRSIDGGGTSTPLFLSPKRRRANTVSVDDRTDNGNETREDISVFESEDSISICESRDNISIDETKGSILPLRDSISETGTHESKNDVLPPETIKLCVCGTKQSLLMHLEISSTEALCV